MVTKLLSIHFFYQIGFKNEKLFIKHNFWNKRWGLEQKLTPLLAC